jgi:methyltransferase family protein
MNRGLALKPRIKTLVPLAWRRHARKLSRFRWITKARIMKSSGVRFFDAPTVWLSYVAWDPEVESFTYDIWNEDELAATLARLTGASQSRIESYFEEMRRDEVLTVELQRRVRWRFEYKSTVRFAGYRMATYALTRARRPAQVVETGILDGLGSLAILRALERNRAEGFAGKLMSLDIVPDSGWLVPERLRQDWEPVYESTSDALERLLEDRHVDLFIHDSDPRDSQQRPEFEIALRHAGPEVILIGANNWGTALRDVAQVHRLTYLPFKERPRHFYEGSPIGFAIADNTRPRTPPT